MVFGPFIGVAVSGSLVALYSSMATPETLCFRMRVPLSVSSVLQSWFWFTVVVVISFGLNPFSLLRLNTFSIPDFLGLNPFALLDLKMLMEFPRLRNREGLFSLMLERGLDSVSLLTFLGVLGFLGFSKFITEVSISVPVFEQYSVKDFVDLQIR